MSSDKYQSCFCWWYMIHFTHFCRWVRINTNIIFIWFSLPAAFYVFLIYDYLKVENWRYGRSVKNNNFSVSWAWLFNLKCEQSEHCSALFLVPGMFPTEFYRVLWYCHCCTQHFSERQKSKCCSPGRASLWYWHTQAARLRGRNGRGSPGSSLLSNISFILKLPERKNLKKNKMFSLYLHICDVLIRYLQSVTTLLFGSKTV